MWQGFRKCQGLLAREQLLNGMWDLQKSAYVTYGLLLIFVDCTIGDIGMLYFVEKDGKCPHKYVGVRTVV